MLSRRRFLSFLVAGAAAATAMPALEKALAAVEPMLASGAASRLGGAYLDLGAANAALKEYYSDQRVENLAYESNPFLAMLPRGDVAPGWLSRQERPVVNEYSGGSFADWSKP